jgi:hypothetical protein
MLQIDSKRSREVKDREWIKHEKVISKDKKKDERNL